MKLWLFLFASFSLYGQFSQNYSFPIPDTVANSLEFVWEQEEAFPFQELLVGWNGERPSQGRYGFLVSVKQEGIWSEWLFYAEWGFESQMMFKELPLTFVETYREQVKSKQPCSGFRVKVFASGGANLSSLRSLYACCSRPDECKIAYPEKPLQTVLLEGIGRQSQITLRLLPYIDYSLPISTTLAINYLLSYEQSPLNPVDFAKNSRDEDFDFYGSWIFNGANASHHLAGHFDIKATHLPDFSALHALLLKGTPVIVGLKGTLSGGPRPFLAEHAVCVIGYDSKSEKVYCIDSYFPNDRATFTAYPLADFLRTWASQKNIALLFQPLM